MPYMQAIGMEKDELVQALGVFFTVATVALAFNITASGLLTAATALPGAIAMAASFAGMFVGQAVRSRMNQQEFRRWFLIALILFFQILVVVRDEAASLRPELIQSVRSLGAGRRALFRYVYLPASLPAVLTALRVSVGTAIAVLFIAETFATREGLGYYIMTLTWGRQRFEEMYAGVAAMSLLGLILFMVVDVLERIVGRWRNAGDFS
jgi:ABC-type spermidine/putrescine transport system permease subunit II